MKGFMMFTLLMNNLFFFQQQLARSPGPAGQFIVKKIGESSICYLLTCRVVDRFS